MVKITSVYCNSSKILMAHLNCTLIDVSRTHSYFSLVLIFKKPVFNFRVDFSLFSMSKREKEFKRLLSFQKVDACSFTDQFDSKFSVFKGQIISLNQTLNGGVHKCPYKSLKIPKISLSIDGYEKLEWFHLPNGVIRAQVQAYNNRDRNIIFFEMDVLQNVVKSSWFFFELLGL